MRGLVHITGQLCTQAKHIHPGGGVVDVGEHELVHPAAARFGDQGFRTQCSVPEAVMTVAVEIHFANKFSNNCIKLKMLAHLVGFPGGRIYRFAIAVG